ncbi:hypothetical protein [Gordonia crocea]|uniref:Uncharacterized protein n=1 Tax=Gordonia crocea TaxID=589162 RepID=A0A7I9V183_9ACTN|nr:hypothetical protein [Gordonia crocea]GED99217.1 hypothetical protein nbrc107697_32560 [Gordonia crocea]
MKLRVLIMSAALATGALAGTVAGITAQAEASTPRLGASCSVSEIGTFARTANGKKVRCTSTGASGVKWVPVAQPAAQ